MAGIDYTIPQQFKGVQIEPPENAMMRAMQMRGLQDTMEMNALKKQEYERARGEENALRRLFSTKGLDTSSPEFLNRLYEEVPGLAPSVEKNILERGKTAAEIEYKQSQSRREAAEALNKKLELYQQIFNPLAVTTEEQAGARTATFYDDPDLAPYAAKMMPKDQAIAASKDLFRTNKDAWVRSQLTISGDKILEATERREKDLRARAEKDYGAYQVREYAAGREPMPQDQFIAQRMAALASGGVTTAPSAPGAVTTPPTAPEAAPSAAETITPEGGEKSLPPITTSQRPSLLGPNVHPLVPELIAAGNKDMATIVQEGYKASGALRQIQDTLAEIERLEDEKPKGWENRRKVLRDYLKVVSTEGPGTKITNVTKLPEAVKAIDQQYAKDYLDWRQGGGTDAAANAGQIKSVLDRFAAGERLSGPSIGLAPDFFNALMNPQALGAKQQIEEVVQRNLRAVLGAQFTQVEGERLISRAFDARLSPQENAKRLRKLFMQIQTAADQKEAMAQYYEANETLRGFKGKTPNMNDFYNVLNAPDAAPKGSVDVKGPDGKVYRFPDKKSADAFKKEHGIKD